MSKGLKTVRVPRAVLIKALTKARLLYIGTAAVYGHDPGPDDECWAEFEALADYVGTTAELITEERAHD